MKSKSNHRKWAILWISLLLAVVCLGMFYLCLTWGFTFSSEINSKFFEMNVGESVDLQQEFPMGIVHGDDLTERGLILDEQGKLHAQWAGRYQFSLAVKSKYLFLTHQRELLRVEVIVHDYEFSDYTPVESYADLQRLRSDEKAILTADLELTKRSENDLINFAGILVNPQGYKILIEDHQPLFRSLKESAIVRGLNLQIGENGFRPAKDNCAPLAASSAGAVVDCTVNGNLYASEERKVSGMVGTLSYQSYLARCRYQGIAFHGKTGSPFGDFKETAFGLVCEGGRLRNCEVRADAYWGDTAEVDKACSLYAFPGQQENPGASEDVRSAGVRVFNLAGDREIDFTKSFYYYVSYQERSPRQMFGFVGSVVPREEWYFDNEEIRLLHFRSSVGGEEDASRPYYLPDTDTALQLEYTFRYRETRWIDSGTIQAAEETIVLPEDYTLSQFISFGDFSPDAVTIVLAPDTEIDGDSGYVSGYGGEKVTLDFSNSEVYEQAADGSVYTDGRTTLCRYNGEVVDGVLTLPDGVTRIGSDPFGELEFSTLCTNQLRLFPESVWNVPAWAQGIRILRFGSAYALPAASNWSLYAFPDLIAYESEPRTDGFSVDERGWLWQGEELRLVPPAYAAGEDSQIILADVARIADYALNKNRAENLIFDGVGQISTNAVSSAQCKAVLFRGNVTVKGSAFTSCVNLVRVEAEEGAAVTLEANAFNSCSALESLELSDSYAAVSYAAVVRSAAFTGYTLKPGCERFVVVDGLLYESGRVQIPRRWKADVLRIPDGVESLQISVDSMSYASEYCNLSTIQIGKDLQSLDLNGHTVRTKRFVLAEGNTAFALEDGVLYNAAKTDLLYVPALSEQKQLRLPSTVRNIAANALRGTGLETVVLNQGLLTIGEAAFRESLLKKIELPEGMISVGDYAFANSKLAGVNFPQSLQKIGAYAFQSTQLRKIQLNEELQSVDKGAFAFCELLGEIEFGKDTTFGRDCFLGTAYLANPDHAVNGGVYLQNLFLGVSQTEGEELVVREGTTAILSLESRTLRRVTVASTVTELPEIGCPNLREIFLLGPTVKLNGNFGTSVKIYLPKMITLESRYYNMTCTIFYDGSAEDFQSYARLSNINLTDSIYFRADKEPTNSGRYWHYVDGEMTAWDNPVEADSFSYSIGYREDASGNLNYRCTIHGYTGLDDVIVTPKYSPQGFLVTEISGLNYGRAREIHFSRGLIDNVYGLEPLSLVALGTECELSQWLSLSCKVLKSDIPAAAYRISGLETLILGRSVRSVTLNLSPTAQVYYEGTEAEWREVNRDFGASATPAVAFYSEQKPTTTGEIRYWYYDRWGAPVLWPSV